MACSIAWPVGHHRKLCSQRVYSLIFCIPSFWNTLHSLLPRCPAGHARHLGLCPQTGLHVFLRTGLYGPYVQRGRDDDPLFHRQALPRVGLFIHRVDRACPHMSC